ncbi:hypothetical protein AB0N79_31820 [Streptomyces microflavus]|uniref:hypothetical protein n=1 Tax=Streptomyces microflavus TaxID=1919 RepID=UPI0034233802
MEQHAHAGLFARILGPSPSADAPAVVLVHGLGLSDAAHWSAPEAVARLIKTFAAGENS